ncbi:hypothetical protein NM688_g2687 [Phlebia brevispora]|uniref:Uncharacterized protein n=1 Tax=Phlebia brevispora TaxID=194682 RepID=A0ACC1T8K1_9APHY|nr:hypothetical protein NM688_g2687 [Phlebia brevispora]
MALMFLQRLWQRIRNPTGLVGRDLEGNRYFEHPNPHTSSGRTKRMVKYRKGFDMWTYVAGERQLPGARIVLSGFAEHLLMLIARLNIVQWTAWLTHTRVQPPTLEELQADLARQMRVRMNAAMIEARDRAAMQIREPQVKGSSSPADASGIQVHGSRAPHDVDGPRSDSAPLGPIGLHTSTVRLPPAPKHAEGSQQNQDCDELQTWKPHTIRRTSK